MGGKRVDYYSMAAFVCAPYRGRADREILLSLTLTQLHHGCRLLGLLGVCLRLYRLSLPVAAGGREEGSAWRVVGVVPEADKRTGVGWSRMRTGAFRLFVCPGGAERDPISGLCGMDASEWSRLRVALVGSNRKQHRLGAGDMSDIMVCLFACWRQGVRPLGIAILV